MSLTHRQASELVHLLCLRQLGAGADRRHFTLKGGANLRFFFGSIRYSEDLDLVVSVVSKTTLRNKVDRLLASPGLTLPLKAKGVSIVEVSAPKQTDATQRWTLGVSIAGSSVPVRTKVEFSRRGRTSDSGAEAVESIDAELARSYGLPPFLAHHVTSSGALTQKIEALIGRPQTQARDVFDLHWLRARIPRLPTLNPSLRKQLPLALERTLSLSFDDFAGQVVAYLVPEQAEAFRGRAAWESIQLQVVQMLEELSP